MGLVIHSERELDILGLKDDEDMNGAMRKHLLHMVKEFADEGHSGFSASYAISCLKRLLNFKPLTPLTGADDEWHEPSPGIFQNIRCSSVFKNADGEAYDIDGKVFWEWYTDEETGEKMKSYYTCYESRVPVTFPYIVPDERIEEYRESGAEK